MVDHKGLALQIVTFLNEAIISDPYSSIEPGIWRGGGISQ